MSPTQVFDQPLGAATESSTLDGQSDLRQRQRAVILAYSRRSAGHGEPNKLMLDAASLIGETLQIPLRGTVDRVDAVEGWRLQIRMPGRGTEPLEHRYTTTAADSLAAYATEKGHPVACANLATETRFKDLFLHSAGIASALLLPLKLDGRTFGAIGLFSREPHEFTTDDIEFADTIAHLLITTIARVEAAQALAAERMVLSAVLDTAESIVIVTDLEGRVTRVNKAGERLTGYSVEGFASRPLWNVIATPGELQLLRQHFRAGMNAEGAANYESDLLTKQGEKRRVRWSQTRMLDANNRPCSMVLTGVDVSEIARLERELSVARSSKGQARSAPPASLAATGATDRGSIPADLAAEAAGAFQVLDDDPQAQRRASPRRAYPYRQLVAPILGNQLPTKDEFIPVQFRDISAGGVSFLIGRRPAFDSLVLELGCEPNVHYMSAKIVNVVETSTPTGTMYLVGCRFLKRVHL